MSGHFLSGHFKAGHFSPGHFGREVVISIPPEFTPEPTFPPGMGRRRQLIEEDDMIMAIIIAFLETKR
jgi:hypothetical protein